jgi:hypothetical protein
LRCLNEDHGQVRFGLILMSIQSPWGESLHL